MNYEISLVTTMAISVMFALSLNLITGFCGQISLGHAAFLGIGAYTGALLGKARQLEERYWTAYRAGQASLTDVIRSREKRLALEASALEARRDYHLARVRFEAATGR